jgi:hypothetical protein
MADVYSLVEARDLLLNDIVCCYNCCQPVNKKYTWVGKKCNIASHLQRIGINEKHWKEITNGLKCPFCGASLDLNANVEVITICDKKVEQIIRQARDPEIIQELSIFHEFLSKYPSLGLSDPNGTGRKLLESVQNSPNRILKPKTWFRARRQDKGRLFSSTEMYAPDPTEVFIKEGRYNHTGQSFLYLASSAYTALSEINNWDDERQCAMQKFRANENIKALDLRHDDRKLNLKTNLLLIAVIYNGYLELIPEPDNSWRPEYFVPRFVADCARLHGYEAVWFSSVWDFGENLVVFPEKKHVFVPEGHCNKYTSKTTTLKL